MSCQQCIRLRLAVPEAVHQVRQIPGVRLEQTDGVLAQGYADAGAVSRLRKHRLVRGVEVLGQPQQVEPVEPMAATVGYGLVEFLHQPLVAVGLLFLVLKQLGVFGQK